MKYAAIADWADRDEYPVDFMCKQLAVSPSGFKDRTLFAVTGLPSKMLRMAFMSGS